MVVNDIKSSVAPVSERYNAGYANTVHDDREDEGKHHRNQPFPERTIEQIDVKWREGRGCENEVQASTTRLDLIAARRYLDKDSFDIDRDAKPAHDLGGDMGRDLLK